MKKIIRAIVILLVVSGYAFAAEDAYWTEEPSALLARAREFSSSQNKDLGIHVLLDESSYAMKSGVIKERRYRMVYLFNESSGLSSWSAVSAPWDTSRAEKPLIRARVISPAGAVTDLDQTTIFERPWDDESSDIYSTTKRLTAPLPNCVVGALVQYEIVLRNVKPYFDAGETLSMYFGVSFPTKRKLLSVRYDRSTLYRVKITLPEGLSVKTDQAGDDTVASYEATGPKLWSSLEPNTPDENISVPVVFISTGSTWKAVADRYRILSEPSIKISDLGPLALARKPGESELDFAERCRKAIIAKGIRYTALHFGDYGLVPASTKDVLARGYGDCKDQAALLLAMLRKEGVKASLALLATGRDRDADPGFPGLGIFDHAIVYVDGDKPFWVDPSARYFPAGRLHSSSEGRFALVVSKGELVKTAVSSSADNRVEEIRSMRLTEEDGAEVSETTFAYGAYDAQYRSNYARYDREKSMKHLDGYLENVFGKHVSMKAEIGDSDDFSKPFRLSLSASDAAAAGNYNRTLFAVIDGKQVFTLEMPDSSFHAAKDGGKEKREKDLLLDKPFSFRIEYLISPPEGYAPDSLPEGRVIRSGGTVYEEKFETLENCSVKATFSFDSGGDRISATDYPAIYKALSGLYAEKRVEIQFISLGEAALEESRISDALKEFTSLSKLHPDRGIHDRQLARVYALLGLREEARAMTAKASAANTDNFIARIDEAIVNRYGSAGLWYGEGWDREGAMKALLKADELDPGNGNTLRNAAIVQALGSDGEWMGPGANADEALKYVSLAEKAGSDCDDLYRVIYEESGRWKESLDFLKPKAKEKEIRDFYLFAFYKVNGAGALMKEARSQIRDMKSRNEAIGSLLERAFRECDLKDAIAFTKAFYADLSLPFPPELKAGEDLLSKPARQAFSYSDPVAALKSFCHAITEGEVTEARKAIAAPAVDYFDDKDVDLMSMMKRAATNGGFNPSTVLPLLTAVWEWGCVYVKNEISPGLYEITINIAEPYAPVLGASWPKNGILAYVVAEGKEFRVVGLEGGDSTTLVCADAWLSEGRREFSAALLKSIHARTESDDMKKILEGSWDADKEAMRCKIGLVLAESGGNKSSDLRARSILYSLPGYPAPASVDGNAFKATLALLELRLGNEEESRNVSKRIKLSELKTDVEVAVALANRGEFAESAKRIAKIEDPAEAVHAARILSDQQYRNNGDAAGAFKTLDDLVKRDFGDSKKNDDAARRMLDRSVANQRCWFALMAGLLKPEDLRELEGLVKNDPDADYAIHTLICGYAVMGRFDEAVTLFHSYGEGVENAEKDLPFLFARALLVEAAGLQKEAKNLYSSIMSDWKNDDSEDSQMVDYSRKRAAALK